MSYAQANTSVEQLQAQMKDLQNQIYAISQKESKQTSTKATVSSLNVGKYLIYDAALKVPLGVNSSSRMPITMLQARSQMPDYALAIGGKTELDATGWWGSKLQPTNYKAWETYQSGKNMYLNEADLYVVGNLGHYVQAAVTFTGASYANPAIEEGYVNLGNLTQTPLKRVMLT